MSTPTPLDEDAVRQVLARAVDLERQRGGSLSETQVREIARELSIPTAAIDQALDEYRNDVGRRPAAHTPTRRWRSGLVFFAILGIAVVVLMLAVVTVRIGGPPR